MKTFKDLEFKPHPNGNGRQAIIFFPNGYGLSIVRFRISTGSYGSYTSNEQEWEAAILTGSKELYTLCYSTPITNDVIGHLSNSEVTSLMRKVQKLPKYGKES